MPHLGRASRLGEMDKVPIEPGKGPQLHAESELMCTFCGKRQSGVAKIITGPVANICDECVGTCSRLIAEQNEPE